MCGCSGREARRQIAAVRVRAGDFSQVGGQGWQVWGLGLPTQARPRGHELGEAHSAGQVDTLRAVMSIAARIGQLQAGTVAMLNGQAWPSSFECRVGRALEGV